MSRSLSADDLIFDWNGPASKPPHRVQVFDETLRDGLQATYVRHPSLDEKLDLLRLMDVLAIDWADVGFPAAGTGHFRDVVGIGKARAQGLFRIALQCAARTIDGDVHAVLQAADSSGYPFEAAIFVGSSNIRKLIEKWDLRDMIRRVRRSVSLAVRHGLTVMFVTEDTTRAHPETIVALYDAAISEGATKLCVCDTVGHATPHGTRRLVEFVMSKIVRGQAGIEVIWHGHQDRGLGLANSIAAIEAGVSAVEGTALGVGERAGNTPMELILGYLWMEGLRSADIVALVDYAECASRILQYPIPPNQPIVGADAFNTGSGVHAAAIRKALDMGREDLAQVVYSGVDPSIVGRTAGARLGKMSGRSSAVLHLRALGIQPTDARVQAVLDAAKRSAAPLSDSDIRSLIEHIDLG